MKTAKDAQPSDVAVIKSASEALSNEISKIGEILAKANAQAGASASAGQAGAQGASGTNGVGGNAGGEGDVKDAEFKEKK